MFQGTGTYSDKRKFPWIPILIFCAAALVITVIVGSILPLFLSDAALNALQNGSGEPDVPPASSTVKKIRAYPHLLGTNLDSVWENPHASVTLNAPSTRLTYTSPTAKELGFEAYRSAELFGSMEALDEAASYISGVFYPNAPYASPALFDANTLCEAALMREFLRAGGDEILIRGLPFGEETIELSDLITYLETLKAAIGDAPLVVAIPLAVLQAGNSHRLLMRVGEVADRLALDLGDADGSLTPEQWLAECDYFLMQYEMRLVLSDTQTTLTGAAGSKNDLQICDAIPLAQSAIPNLPTPDSNDE